MRTHAECDGVGPSSTNSWYQLGGLTFALGGAVIVHVVPEQENAGKMMRPPPMTLPCVFDEAVVGPLSVCVLEHHGGAPRLTCDERHPHRTPLE